MTTESAPNKNRSFASVLATAVCLIAALLPTRLGAAPFPELAALAGEWRGQSSSGLSGAALVDDSRRYWIEGDELHGERVLGSGVQARIERVVVIARNGFFLKIVASSGEPSQWFVGLPTESGIVWSGVEVEKLRYVERVSGTGEQRRLELLASEADATSESWRMIGTLRPVAAANGVAVARSNPPAMPDETTLRVVDRVAALVRERNTMRLNNANVARELGTAWRELEASNGRVKELEARLSEAAATAPQGAEAAATGGESTASAEQLAVATKAAADAQAWAGQLEKSLSAANARADTLTKELEALKSQQASVAADGQAARQALIIRVADLEKQLNAARQQQPQPGGGPELVAAKDSIQRLEAELTKARTWSEGVAAEKEALLKKNSELAAVADRATDLEKQLTAANALAAQLGETNKGLEPKVAEMDATSARLAETERQLAEARAQVQDIATARDALQQKLAQSDAGAARTQELEGRLAQVSDERAGLQGRVEAMEKQVLATEEKLTASQRELEAVRAASAATSNDAAATTAALQTARAEVETAMRNATALTRERDEARSRAVELETALENLRADASGSAESIATTAAELAALKTALKSAEEARDDAAGRLAVVDENVEQLTKANERLAQANRTLQAEAAELKTSTDRAAADLRALQARVDEASQAGQSSDARLVALESELKAVRAELVLAKDRQVALETAAVEARSGREATVQQATQLESDLAAARARVVELEQANQEARGQLAGLEREVASLQAQPTETSARVAGLEERLAATFARLDERQQEADRLNARVRELEVQNEVLANRLESRGQPVSGGTAISANIVELNNRLAESERARLALEARSEELTRRLRDLEVQLAAASPRPVISSPPPSRTVASTTARTREPAQETDEIEFRLPPASEPAPVAVRTQAPTTLRRAEYVPPRPAPTRAESSAAAAVAGGDSRLAQVVRSLPIYGFRKAGANSLVVVGGRTYRIGDTVDAAAGLRFVRVDEDALVFTGPDGAEYRRSI